MNFLLLQLLFTNDVKMRASGVAAKAALVVLLTVVFGKTSVDSTHTSNIHLPEPFIDILDVPPELRSIPERPTIYDLISIPSMDDTTSLRISFAPTRPRHIPGMPAIGLVWNQQSGEFLQEPPISIFKRDHSPPLRACPVTNEWIHVTTATDIYNVQVEVSQLQWFWHTTCLQENQACFGFPSSVEDGSFSECRETNSWVMAWAREVGETEYSWRHIAIPTCCSCAVTEGRLSAEPNTPNGIV
ncbi:uncharacterized protein LOC117291851 [Asterias rubens]|uniref:uncharacterized protein LOC117291851 n=1 Tax=Asterias rubens TaxID=7604 RepID=UPI00145535B3|nr:uncharacterized protein LOC117291851 [Asterias rubens]